MFAQFILVSSYFGHVSKFQVNSSNQKLSLAQYSSSPSCDYVLILSSLTQAA